MGVTNHLLTGMILQVGLHLFFEQPTVTTLNVWMASLVISSTIEQLNASSASPFQTFSTHHKTPRTPTKTHDSFLGTQKIALQPSGQATIIPKLESFGYFEGHFPYEITTIWEEIPNGRYHGPPTVHGQHRRPPGWEARDAFRHPRILWWKRSSSNNDGCVNKLRGCIMYQVIQAVTFLRWLTQWPF